jgi:hypothetical protein
MRRVMMIIPKTPPITTPNLLDQYAASVKVMMIIY